MCDDDDDDARACEEIILKKMKKLKRIDRSREQRSDGFSRTPGGCLSLVFLVSCEKKKGRAFAEICEHF
jgi:hypothetical protein